MLNNKFLFLLIIILLVSGGCTQSPANNTDKGSDLIDISEIEAKEANYKTVLSEKGSIFKTDTTEAAVAYERMEILTFGEVEGKLDTLYAANRDMVTKGQLLASLVVDEDHILGEISKKEERLNNDISIFKSNIQSKSSAIEKINTESGEIQRLTKKKLQEELNFYIYDTNLKLEKQKKEIEELKTSLNQNEIYAPFDGYIYNITYLSKGDKVKAGEPIMTIFGSSKALVRVNGLTNVYRYNADVEVIIPATSETIKGRVISDPIEANYGEYSQEYVIELLEPTSKFLLEYRLIRAQCRYEEVTDVCIVPLRAVRNEETKRYVYVLENDVVKKRYVQTGYNDTENIQIISGLEIGAEIIMD